MFFRGLTPLLKVSISTVTLFSLISAANAENPGKMITDVVEKHARVLSAKKGVEAARYRAKEALGAWYPTLTPTANYGREFTNANITDNVILNFREVDLSLTQLLWDFGKTDAAVKTARLVVETSDAALVTARQGLLLEAATAYANLMRSYASLAFARESEGNIRQQTELENARVAAGDGLSTDVLQAKTQLASAQSRLIQSEGALTTAKHRFEAIFDYMPVDLANFEKLTLANRHLPDSLKQALKIALINNPRILTAKIEEETALQSIRETKATEFMPIIEGTAEQKWKHNVAAVAGPKRESLIKVEMTLPFNLGLSGLDSLRANRSDATSKALALVDLRRTIREEVSNAWTGLQTAQRNADALLTQANISSAFLELARKERQLGQRSLIDVLSGETSLINAQSDALSAEADITIAKFTLLSAMGMLEYASLEADPLP